MSNVYIEPVRADFWQLYREPGGGYLDPLGPRNCMTHSAARAVMRATEGVRPAGTPGAWPPTGYEIRRHCIDPNTGLADTSGGVNHTQVKSAVKRLYGVDLTLYYGNSFDDMVDLSAETRGIMVSLWYEPIRDNIYRRGSFTFYQNHEIWIPNVDRSHSRFIDVVDPLADGRQTGLFHGPGAYSFNLIKNAMGRLNVASSGYRALGYGKGYFATTKITGAPPASPRFNVTITGYTPLYKTPGGTRVTAVRKAAYRCGRTYVNGQWWYRIISRTDYSLAVNRGLYFRPNANTKVVPA